MCLYRIHCGLGSGKGVVLDGQPSGQGDNICDTRIVNDNVKMEIYLVRHLLLLVMRLLWWWKWVLWASLVVLAWARVPRHFRVRMAVFLESLLESSMQHRSKC